LIDYPSVNSVQETTQIEFIGRCANLESVNAPAQVDPADYYYTNSGLEFTLNPYTVTPTGCGVIVYSCEVISGSRTDLCLINEAETVATFDAVHGHYSFKSSDMESFSPGEFLFKITGTAEDKSASSTFTVTFVDPCPTATLSLVDPSPFTDQTVYRMQDNTQSWSFASVVTSSTAINCGPMELVFTNDDGS
jgi:hypothetical protein